MILTNKEKRTTWIAAAGGAAVLLIYFVGLPLWNRWTALGAALEPKVSLLDKLEERANVQNALLARRDALASELGAVEGRAEPANPVPGAPLSGPPRGVPSPRAPTPAAPPATAVSTGPRAAMPSPGAPAHAVSIAAYVERQANTLRIPFKSVTPYTPALGYRDGKSLTPVGVEVTFETATPSFLRLLYALEKGDRLLRVEKMDIRHDLKKGPTIAATLRIVGYEAASR